MSITVLLSKLTFKNEDRGFDSVFNVGVSKRSIVINIRTHRIENELYAMIL